MPIVNRNLIGSDIAIVLTCFLHTFEGGAFVFTASANGSIGMSSLLHVFYSPRLAAAVLTGAVAAAVMAEWCPGLSRIIRGWLLLPQFSLLLITMFGALYFVMIGHYADGVERSWVFIFCDQMQRIGMPVWYGVAMIARMRD